MKDDAAEVTIPSAERKAELQAIINNDFPTLCAAYFVIDGLELIFKMVRWLYCLLCSCFCEQCCTVSK